MWHTGVGVGAYNASTGEHMVSTCIHAVLVPTTQPLVNTLFAPGMQAVLVLTVHLLVSTLTGEHIVSTRHPHNVGAYSAFMGELSVSTWHKHAVALGSTSF